MSKRTIEVVVPPREAHYVGDGFRVHNFIPHAYRLDRERMNPFLMLDYNSKFYVPPSDTPRGVGVHPHRGFETVTIAYKGRVAHHDSSGGGGVIGEGDVQWMTAASGILHKEYHEESFSKEGGDFQMVQLWINLPAKDKMSPPKYQSITNADLAKRELPEGGLVEVIAGEYQGVQGTAETFTPVHLYNIQLRAGGHADCSFPKHYNTGLLVIEGEVLVNDAEWVPTDHFVLFENDGEEFSIRSSEDALALVMSGEPIDEPIVADGPFVMNTVEELIQAFHDFGGGKFGHLK